MALAHIFVLDDDENLLEVLEEILTEADYDVSTYTEAEAMIKALAFDQPELIILDVKMKEMDGYKVCKLIKSQPNLGNVKVVFLSALSSPKDIRKGLKLGADDYITKPFNNKDLLFKIQYILG